MKPPPPIWSACEGQLIVSCQAEEGSAFRDPAWMARFALAAVNGGAKGIRANGPDDILSIRRAVSVPIIGIQKTLHEDSRILITASFEAARRLVEAGADIVALDCTARGQRLGAFDRLRRIRSELHTPVMADIATVEEATAAAAAGADLVATTLRGYTDETRQFGKFDPESIAEIARTVDVPVLAEGRVWTPEEARAALRAGAFAVIVGTAITRPEGITRRFAASLAAERDRNQACYLVGVDLGGTYTKYGVVSSAGELIAKSARPTPATAGREALLMHLKAVVRESFDLAHGRGVFPSAIGVATAGWVDPGTGRVVYASTNLPGWSGTAIMEELHTEFDLPIAVENDGNAHAIAERRFGLAQGCDHFALITLGTGVGGGCYIGGRLNRGARFLANGIGHLPIETEGRLCTCGGRGCLETVVSAGALLRYAASRFPSAEAVIRAAGAGDELAQQAVRTCGSYLARGCMMLIRLLNPERIILSGGLAQSNRLMLDTLRAELAKQLASWETYGVQIDVSRLGSHGGVYGAAAAVLEKLEDGVVDVQC